MTVTKDSPTGSIVRQLEPTSEGFRRWLVRWRGSLFRLSFKREPRGFVLGEEKRREIVAPSLTIAVAACDAEGNALDAPPIDAGVLEELKSQARTLASWSGA